MDGFRPEDSYGTCLVIAPDPKQLFDAFAAGLRSRYGRLPLAGFPRITRPRRRKNADGFTGFSLVDPGGNWIRVTGVGSATTTRLRIRGGWPAPSPTPSSSATRTATWTRRRRSSAAPSGGTRDDAPTVELLEALAYLLELAIRRRDPAAAREALGRIDALEPSDADRTAAAGALASIAELRAATEDLDGADQQL